MRLFTGIAIDRDVIAALEEFVRTVKPKAPVRWIPPENLHITVRFLGEWPQERLPALEDALGRMGTPPSPLLKIGGVEFLPDARRPRLICAGVEAEASLKDLVRLTDAALGPLGYQPEDRPYTPHVTLARVKTENVRPLREHLQSSEAPQFGSFRPDAFHLYLSKTGSKGSVYEQIASWRFQAL